MWSPQVLIYYAAPVVVTAAGVYLLYRATQLESSSADRAFAMGIILVLSAWGFTAARSSRKREKVEHDLETKIQDLCKRIRRTERRSEALQNTLDSKIAAEVFLAAMERADEHRGKNWVHFHHAE